MTKQVAGNFQIRDPYLAKYLAKVQVMAAEFEDFSLVYVPM